MCVSVRNGQQLDRLFARGMNRSRRGDGVAALSVLEFEGVRDGIDQSGVLAFHLAQKAREFYILNGRAPFSPMVLRSVPTFSSSISMTSPGCMAAVDPGVPVKIMSPGFSVT